MGAPAAPAETRALILERLLGDTGEPDQVTAAARALADTGFRTRSRPVPRAELAAEHVGPAFLDYLAAGWDDLVA